MIILVLSQLNRPNILVHFWFKHVKKLGKLVPKESFITKLTNLFLFVFFICVS